MLNCSKPYIQGFRTESFRSAYLGHKPKDRGREQCHESVASYSWLVPLVLGSALRRCFWICPRKAKEAHTSGLTNSCASSPIHDVWAALGEALRTDGLSASDSPKPALSVAKIDWLAAHSIGNCGEEKARQARKTRKKNKKWTKIEQIITFCYKLPWQELIPMI